MKRAKGGGPPYQLLDIHILLGCACYFARPPSNGFIQFSLCAFDHNVLTSAGSSSLTPRNPATVEVCLFRLSPTRLDYYSATTHTHTHAQTHTTRNESVRESNNTHSPSEEETAVLLTNLCTLGVFFSQALLQRKPSLLNQICLLVLTHLQRTQITEYTFYSFHGTVIVFFNH